MYAASPLLGALFYAGVFHSLHRASSLTVPVTMANTVNLVNANGVVVARAGGAVRAATFHVWDLYQNHLGPVALAADVRSPSRLASVRQGDRIDALPPQVAVKDLGADVDDVLALNSLSDPDRVALQDRGVIELPDGGYDFPPHSITLLSFSLRS